MVIATRRLARLVNASLILGAWLWLLSVAVCQAAGGQPASAPWQDCPKGFTYHQGQFQCQVRPDGTMGEVRFKDLVLLRDFFLHGTYHAAPGDKHDTRFFQMNAASTTPLRVRREGKGRYLLTKQGILKNQRYPRAATYQEQLHLSPGIVQCDYQVQLLVPLSSNHNIFLTLAEVPLGTLAGRGYRKLTGDGGQQLSVFPRTYVKATAPSLGNIKELCAVVRYGWLTVRAGQDTTISGMDTRSYGGQDFRFDAYSPLPWTSQPQVRPAGTSYHWSVTWEFCPFPEIDRGVYAPPPIIYKIQP